MGSAASREAVGSIRNWAVTEGRKTSSQGRATELFGSLVFSDEVQRARLPKQVYKALRRTIKRGETLDQSAADVVASAMKEWAIEQGATHYTHWFQPMTGLTAEKHDSFLSPRPKAAAIAEFSGKELVRGEPDASSFPSGGIRATFEARGYTAWDPTSPRLHPREPQRHDPLSSRPPSARWTGEALDKKTPLLRSMEALSKQAVRILKLFGSRGRARRHDRRARAGILPDRQELLLRPARPDQRRPDPLRRQAAQGPGDGGPLLRRHPRARPGLHARDRDRAVQARRPGQDPAQRGRARQYEIAPIFENANVATDHNMLVMETMKRVAPTATASSSCCTRSRSPASTARASTSTGRCPTTSATTCSSPGDTPHDNAQFLVFLRRRHPRRATARRPAPGGRRHRRQRPPPGRQRGPAGDHLGLPRRHAPGHRRADREGRRQEHQGGRHDEIGVSVLPTLPRDAGDRNRTSPFAFTGNKFEFRAVSSSQSIAMPNIC